MNHNINTIIIAPLTTKSRNYPTRIKITFKGRNCWIVLDQIRCIDKLRLMDKAGSLDKEDIIKVKNIIKEMLVD